MNLVIVVAVLLLFVVIFVKADNADDTLLIPPLQQDGDVDVSRPILTPTGLKASAKRDGGDK